ncbi:MAG TPA: DUF1538 domain-containing protein [Gammaproteobacteria bacterium]
MAVIINGMLTIAGTALNVLPVILFLFVFQRLILRRKFANVERVAAGFGFVVVGLGLFLIGLEQGLFPLGYLLAEQLIAVSLGEDPASSIPWYGYYWVLIFAFAIGFGTTVAEPSLLAVALKANEVSGGAIHTWGLRVAVALGVAVGVALGCFRIVTGTPLHWYIIAGYIFLVVQTAFSPKLITALAYDSGGVTTSTVTVPLVTALGLGLAEHVPGRDPLVDGFGLIAFASLFPIISVLGYAQIAALRAHHGRSRQRSRRPDSALKMED